MQQTPAEHIPTNMSGAAVGEVRCKNKVRQNLTRGMRESTTGMVAYRCGPLGLQVQLQTLFLVAENFWSQWWMLWWLWGSVQPDLCLSAPKMNSLFQDGEQSGDTHRSEFAHLDVVLWPNQPPDGCSVGLFRSTEYPILKIGLPPYFSHWLYQPDC